MSRRVRLTPYGAAGPYGRIEIASDAWPAVNAVVYAPGAPPVTARPNGILTMSGQRVPTTTGPGLDPRRSARTCTVLAAGHRYELRFRSLRHATLTWSPEAEPLDTAIGQALVLAYGAGAPGALTRIAFFWLVWFG